MVFLGKGGKTDKQDSKESKSTDDKGKTGKTASEQEEKPPPLPSAYDEDLKLRAAMYGVLFQAYADKVSHCPCQLYCGTSPIIPPSLVILQSLTDKLIHLRCKQYGGTCSLPVLSYASPKTPPTPVILESLTNKLSLLRCKQWCGTCFLPVLCYAFQITPPSPVILESLTKTLSHLRCNQYCGTRLIPVLSFASPITPPLLVILKSLTNKLSHLRCKQYSGTRLLPVLRLRNNSTITSSTRERNRQVESLTVLVVLWEPLASRLILYLSNNPTCPNNCVTLLPGCSTFVIMVQKTSVRKLHKFQIVLLPNQLHRAARFANVEGILGFFCSVYHLSGSLLKHTFT